MRTSPLQLIALLLAFSVATAGTTATVWKWVDKSGVTHYSDQPVPGAVQVDLLNVQTYSSDDATIPATDRQSKVRGNAASSYATLAISAPADEETIIGTVGQVRVSVQVQPELQQGHSIRLTMDGQVVSQPNSADTSFELQEVTRGAHTLVASVISHDGQMQIQSAPVTFYIQQPSTQDNKRTKRK
jgi:hypothetical protein